MSKVFHVIPAIDLLGGQCVRLYKGDYEQVTVYNEDPVDQALQWQAQGAKRLHIVDLDGARSGKRVNGDAIEAITKAVSIPVDLGGGIRTRGDLETILGWGIRWAILGTVAVEDPDFVRDAARENGESLLVGIDARDGIVATGGWLAGTETSTIEMARALEDAGVAGIVYTDIERDGTLTGPGLASTAELCCGTTLEVTAAGGVSRLEDLRALLELNQPNLVGVISGKALYEGRFTMQEALDYVRRFDRETEDTDR